MNRILRAVVPGSFDPVHNAHLRVLSQAAQLFDEVIWALGINSSKSPMFTVAERLEMMQLLNEFKNVKVMTYAGMLAQFALERQATHIVRSLRAVMDFEYETQFTYF